MAFIVAILIGLFVLAASQIGIFNNSTSNTPNSTRTNNPQQSGNNQASNPLNLGFFPITSAPTLAAFEYNGTQVTLSWNYDKEVTFKIFRDGVQIGETDQKTFTDTSLQPGVNHCYSVQADKNSSDLFSAIALKKCIGKDSEGQNPSASASPAASTLPTPEPEETPEPTIAPTPKPSKTPTPSPTPKPRINAIARSAQQILDLIDQMDNGGVLYIPQGIYDMPKGFSVKSNITVFGDGIGKTVLRAASNFNDSKMISTSGTVTNVVVRDMSLIGPGTGGRKDDCCYGLRLRNMENSFFINIESRAWSQDGIYLGYSSGKGVKNVRITGCNSSGNGRNGISLVAAEGVVVDNCQFNNNNLNEPVAAVDLEPDDDTVVSNNKILNNRVSNNKNDGIGLTNCAEGHRGPIQNNAVCNNTVSNNKEGTGIAECKRESMPQLNTTYVNNNLSGNGQNQLLTSSAKNGPASNCSIPASLSNIPARPAIPNVQGVSTVNSSRGIEQIFVNLLNGLKGLLQNK